MNAIEAHNARHVDAWLDTVKEPCDLTACEDYARWVIEQFRMPAWKKMMYEECMRKHALYCTFEGQRLRVTGASTLGKLELQRSFHEQKGGQYAAYPDECSNWSRYP